MLVAMFNGKDVIPRCDLCKDLLFKPEDQDKMWCVWKNRDNTYQSCKGHPIALDMDSTGCHFCARCAPSIRSSNSELEDLKLICKAVIKDIQAGCKRDGGDLGEVVGVYISSDWWGRLITAAFDFDDD